MVAELDRELVGLDPVKTRIREIAALLVIDRRGAEFGLDAERPTLHMCSPASPGTGKTTVAMQMAQVLNRLGYIAGAALVAVHPRRAGRPVHRPHGAENEGGAPPRMGGVLFIDEAYYLYRAENERDYGQEAIEILLQVMEAERENIVVIFAGYKDRMDEFFRATRASVRASRTTSTSPITTSTR